MEPPTAGVKSVETGVTVGDVVTDVSVVEELLEHAATKTVITTDNERRRRRTLLTLGVSHGKSP
jgi:hypothetical protein